MRFCTSTAYNSLPTRSLLRSYRIFSSECIDFPAWKKFILRSVFVSVEKTYIECTKDFGYINEHNAAEYGKSCFHCNWCFQPWKDVLMPGFVEKWSLDKMR